MRLLLVFSALILSAGCATTTPFISYSGNVSVAGTNAALSSSSNFFNPQSVQKADSVLFIDDRADHYLNLILEGYASQTDRFSFSDDQNSAMSFEVKDVRVKTGYFSLNLVDPGPILKMTMQVDVFYYGEYVETETYKTRVNMAQVINPDKMWNWLTLEEKNDVNNQIATFEIGLRSLYRDLFFKHLDISLSL